MPAKISRNLKSSLNAIPSLLAQEAGRVALEERSKVLGPKLLRGLGSLRTIVFNLRPGPSKKDVSAFRLLSVFFTKLLYHSYLLKDELGIYLYLISKTFFCRFYDI